MAALHQSDATLRIWGDTLNPDEISRHLGCQPSFAFAKGDIKPSKIRPVIMRSGMWGLEATMQQPADLDSQIAEIFDRLPKDPAVWRRLGEEFDIDIFCGFWMREEDEGMTVSTDTMKILSDRNIIHPCRIPMRSSEPSESVAVVIVASRALDPRPIT